MDIITYDMINKIRRAERESRSLKKLPENFFEAVKAWRGLKQGRTDNDSLQELKSSKGLLDEIVRVREEKIIQAALSTIRVGETPPQSLLHQEQKFFDRVIILVTGFRSEIDHMFLDVEDVESRIKELRRDVEDLRRRRIKILQELPEVLGPDSKPYGPFKEGDVVELSPDIAELLIKRGAAEESKAF